MWLLGLATGYELMPVNMILSLEQVLRHAIQASPRVNFFVTICVTAYVAYAAASVGYGSE